MLPTQQTPAAYQNPLAPNLSDRDFSGHMAAVSSKGGLNVGFFYARVQLKTRRAQFNGQFETRLFVAMQPKGDRFTIAKEPITERDASTRFPAEFAAFRNYQDTPSRGTPLMELPGISQSQIALLAVNGIRSIEDLVGLSPDVVAQVGMEASTAFKIAQRWVSKKTDAGDDVEMAGQVAALEIENRTQKDTIRDMEAQMKALQAQVDAMARIGATGIAASSGPAAHIAPGTDEPFAMPDTSFGDGGPMATGNDDLLTNDPDPLQN